MKARYVFVPVMLLLAVTTRQLQAEPSTTEKVKTWTKAEWNKARAEFAKDKIKWTSCRKQSRDMNLKGSKSWSYLYDCMKT